MSRQAGFHLARILGRNRGRTRRTWCNWQELFALEAAMSIACSVAGGDLVGLAPAHTGRVVYLAGEDPQPALVRRVHAIGQHLNQSAREAIAENLTLEPIMGKRLNVMDEAHLRRVIDYSAGRG